MLIGDIVPLVDIYAIVSRNINIASSSEIMDNISEYTSYLVRKLKSDLNRDNKV